MGILEVLTIVFVVLKLIGVSAVATWSWLIVLSPLIVAILLYAGIVVLSVVFGIRLSQKKRKF